MISSSEWVRSTISPGGGESARKVKDETDTKVLAESGLEAPKMAQDIIMGQNKRAKYDRSLTKKLQVMIIITFM